MSKLSGRVKFHPRQDPLDVGFNIEGVKLRWISAKKSESAGDRPWSVLQVDSMPDELVKYFKERRPGMIKDNTIRNNDLILAFAPDEEAEVEKQAKAQARQEQKAAVNKSGSEGGGVTVKSEKEAVPVAELASAESFKKQK